MIATECPVAECILVQVGDESVITGDPDTIHEVRCHRGQLCKVRNCRRTHARLLQVFHAIVRQFEPFAAVCLRSTGGAEDGTGTRGEERGASYEKGCWA